MIKYIVYVSKGNGSGNQMNAAKVVDNLIKNGVHPDNIIVGVHSLDTGDLKQQQKALVDKIGETSIQVVRGDSQELIGFKEGKSNKSTMILCTDNVVESEYAIERIRPDVVADVRSHPNWKTSTLDHSNLHGAVYIKDEFAHEEVEYVKSNVINSLDEQKELRTSAYGVSAESIANFCVNSFHYIKDIKKLDPSEKKLSIVVPGCQNPDEKSNGIDLEIYKQVLYNSTADVLAAHDIEPISLSLRICDDRKECEKAINELPLDPSIRMEILAKASETAEQIAAWASIQCITRMPAHEFEALVSQNSIPTLVEGASSLDECEHRGIPTIHLPVNPLDRRDADQLGKGDDPEFVDKYGMLKAVEMGIRSQTPWSKLSSKQKQDFGSLVYEGGAKKIARQVQEQIESKGTYLHQIQYSKPNVEMTMTRVSNETTAELFRAQKAEYQKWKHNEENSPGETPSNGLDPYI